MVDLDDVELDGALEAIHLGFRALVAAPDRLLSPRGLGRSHHRILYLVQRRPGIAVGGLIERLGVTKQAVSAPLRELVEQRLVAARSSAADGRQKVLSLTAAGRRLEAALTGDQHERLRSAFRGIDAREIRAWRNVTRRIADGGDRARASGG
ncbi:MAG: MarR family transcriptional regulator [Candidatus Eremiobacteraeota bacterium]|nr:MarR family transcriptional regulator [Candidatus Eremiobacteraeota bacterium]